MTAIRCTAPARGHVPGSQAQRQCPVHGDHSARMSPLPAPPAPESASEHKQTVHPDGTVTEKWHKDGKLHRGDGPALVERYPDGTVIEWWCRNDKLHRIDGPAYVERRPDGTVVEGGYRNGVVHREDGPAWVRRSPDGTVVEQWRKNDELHREDGPAWVERRPDGTTESEAWYLDGTEVGAWEVLGRYLTTRDMPGLSAEALRQIARDVPWQRWSELGPDHPLVALWAAVHPRADISAG